jgi:hypothetical protein
VRTTPASEEDREIQVESAWVARHWQARGPGLPVGHCQYGRCQCLPLTQTGDTASGKFGLELEGRSEYSHIPGSHEIDHNRDITSVVYILRTNRDRTDLYRDPRPAAGGHLEPWYPMIS